MEVFLALINMWNQSFSLLSVVIEATCNLQGDLTCVKFTKNEKRFDIKERVLGFMKQSKIMWS